MATIKVTFTVVGTQEIEWPDDHPLNKCGTMARAWADLFPITHT